MKSEHQLIDDPDLDAFIYDARQRYTGYIKSLEMDSKLDDNGNHYLVLCGIQLRPKAKGQGIGSEVMSDIIDYADSRDLPIRLWATDIFGANVERLVGFYEKFGFIRTDDENNMVYFPRKKFIKK